MSQRRGILFRTVAELYREHGEELLLAYVLHDASGAAARLMVELGTDLAWSTAAAGGLAAELAAWAATGGDQTPRTFVEQRWHGQTAAYRAYVTDLLERDIPEGGETERAVRESIQRLRLARRVQPD